MRETPRSERPNSPARHLGPMDAAIFDTEVAPNYLSRFANRLLDLLVVGRDARVCHVACRTGYPDPLLFEKLPNAHIYGCDTSEYAIELAKGRARDLPSSTSDYRVVDGYAVPFPNGAFSHALTLHPLAAPAERKVLVDELARIVASRGQALIAMPLRGSFGEIADLLRECALKYELDDLTHAVEAAVQLRPSGEILAKELEVAGFEHVRVDAHTETLTYGSGRAFFEDPTTRLMLLPEFRVNLAMADTDAAFAYVQDAIDKYWSDASFELTVNIGVITGRRK